MRQTFRWAAALACFVIASASQAEEKILYRYDALGRLIKSYRQTGPAAGTLDATLYDKAGNRTVYDAANVMQTLQPGQSMLSPDGRFRLAMQTDGNPVLYQSSTVLWVAPDTYGISNTAVFQNVGNFVVYGPSGALWSAAIQSPGAKLFLQNDGNLVIYSLDDVPVWATGTSGH